MTFLKALAAFLGTVIGVGIFGLPYIASKAGFFVVAGYFGVMTIVALLVALAYTQVVVGTKEKHRLPGYVQEYLGIKWKNFTFFIILLSLMGAMLAYLIVGGQFISSYFGIDVVLATLIFFTIGSFLMYKGIKSVASIELILLCLLFFILASFFVNSFSSIEINHFKTFNLEYLLLPYGVILFSLWGNSVIPEIKEMLYGTKVSLSKVVLVGIVFSAVIYIFFIYIIQGASIVVSKDAISGLEASLGSGYVRLGYLFGIVACFTSFITIGLSLKKALWYDFRLSRNIAWGLTSFIPLVLFFSGLREFIEVISFTGAIALGIEGIIIVLLYRGFLLKNRRKISPLYYLIPGVFILGIMLEIFLFYGNIIGL